MKALLILLLSAALARAGTEAATTEEEEEPRFSGDAGVSLTNAFIFNGLVQGKDQLITQPYVTINFELAKGKNWDAGLTLPLWASIHRSSWYELDISPGMYFTLAKNWSLTISDYIYTSPAGDFEASHNLSVALSYDDSDIMGAFALHPYFNFQQELSSHAGLALDGSAKGQYYEVGIEPSCTLKSVTVSAPVSVGMGSSGFFGQGFGYVAVGVQAEVPLSFIPEVCGSWKASTSVKYYHFGSTSAFYTNSGKSHQWVGAFTVGTEF